MAIKTIVCAGAGAVAAAVAQLFGGWSECLTVLLILMAIDYISGLVVAGVFHHSPKSETGALESRAGLKGLIRKIFVVCMVVVAHLIDRLIGTDYIRDAAAIAFCLNEVISIFENAGLMGVPLPKVLTKALDVLRQKAGETDVQEDEDEHH
jgi:toxin secretion/phage lysis holin